MTTKIVPPPTAAEIVRDLVHEAKHCDNLSEFIHACLGPAWERVGLPGKLPLDQDRFIDLPEPDMPEWDAITRGFGCLSALIVQSESVTVQPALFIMFDTSDDVGFVSDHASANGLETYEFRRDLVVALPPR